MDDEFSTITITTERSINPEALWVQDSILHGHLGDVGFVQIEDEILMVKKGEDSVKNDEGLWETKLYRYKP
jgi:hypothetical protein